MDPLDALLTQLEDVEEEELKPIAETVKKGPRLIEMTPTTCKENQKNEESSSSSSGPAYEEDNSDDDELYVKKRELTEQGLQLEKYLKKNSSTSGPKATDAFKSNKKSMLTGLTKPDSETVTVGIVRFDKFQISIRNPKISASSFGAFAAGMKLERLSNLKPTSSFKEAWCTMAVIVEKGFKKKSANGNDFLIWKLHDLKDCQLPPVKLLMFGDAIKDHWEIKLGSVIALVSAQVADDSSASGNNKTVSVTLKVAKSNNIVEIGQSAHYGTCKGTRQQDGQRCSNFVNSSLSEFCVFHMMSAARKLSAKRGVFNALTCGPNVGGLSFNKQSLTPKSKISHRPGIVASGLSNSSGSPLLRDTMRPADSNTLTKTPSALKQITKEEEKSSLNDILSERKNTFGARQMLKLKEKNDEKTTETMEEMIDFMANNEKEEKPKHSSFGEFLKSDTAKEKTQKIVDLRSTESSSNSGGSKLWTMSMTRNNGPVGHKDAQEHAARLRAIAILKAKRKETEQGGGGGVKRKAVESPSQNENSNAKRSKNQKMDEIKALLARKSSHHKEADKAEHDMIQRHLTGMEEREKVETFTTTCMEVKNVKVVTCNQCKYTAQFASSECIKKEHKLITHTADKRFFKCSGCKKRTVCFEMMPIKHCSHCNENKWERVAMKDERKVVLETENLLVRGEERPFVNS
uniref:Protein MCM10 homolog n=1 Tax=Caenorhabditis tropicalis TaxID=1561998 RepID=A0A1I7UZ25_9PELO